MDVRVSTGTGLASVLDETEWDVAELFRKQEATEIVRGEDGGTGGAGRGSPDRGPLDSRGWAEVSKHLQELRKRYPTLPSEGVDSLLSGMSLAIEAQFELWLDRFD